MAQIYDFTAPQQENDAHFVVITPTGESIDCEILFTFQSDDFGKDYIVYTDNSLDENGEQRIYAAIYDPEGNDLALQEIKTRAEWEMIDRLLEDY